MTGVDRARNRQAEGRSVGDGNGAHNSAPTSSNRPQLTTMQRKLVAGVAVGAALIALIGFVGSYAAVAALAEAKGFGWFAVAFPLGIDAGILVLLALDLLLTWMRMPLAMLRQTAWLLTVATIAFNGAVAWPDPLGVGMHAVIPVLFVVVVEAARHAIGRTAEITAGRHMDAIRLSRWLLDPVRTFVMWRRMKLWELRSYDDVISLEQGRKIERARLRARYGRRWRSKAPVDAVLALHLTRYGRPLGPVEGVLDIEPAPAAPAPELQGAPDRPALEPAPPAEGAPKRPALEPERPAPYDEDASPRPNEGDKPAPETTEEPAPDRPEGDEDEAPRDQPTPPTRAEAKRRIRALYDELNARPKEGRIVDLLKSLDGYPHTSRRHAQKLRDEIEAKEPKLTERGADNVTALTGT
jgi:hypothetical protein